MILSVLKNTQRPVKFWFIKNYLSPQFKVCSESLLAASTLAKTMRSIDLYLHTFLLWTSQDVIPHMAHEYGFDYALITYKWPTWLHKQKEKQRIIWAYKILFLDVIFPVSLEKVSMWYLWLCLWLSTHAIFSSLWHLNSIDPSLQQVIFVDADQVVRADMGELYDMDLKGRPLAYTPFCDNNKEMDGYRFWRQVHIESIYSCVLFQAIECLCLFRSIYSCFITSNRRLLPFQIIAVYIPK